MGNNASSSTTTAQNRAGDGDAKKKDAVSGTAAAGEKGVGANKGERKSIALLRESSALLRELVEEIGVPDEIAVDLVEELQGDHLRILRTIAKRVNDEDPDSHLAGQARSSKISDKFRRSIHAKEIDSLRKLGFSDVHTLRALRETRYNELEAIKLLLKEHHRHVLSHAPSDAFRDRTWASADAKDESKGTAALKADDIIDPSTPKTMSSPATLHSSTPQSRFGSNIEHEEPPALVVTGIPVAAPVIRERRAHDKAMLRALKGRSSVKWNPALVRAMVAMKRKADDAKETVRKRDAPGSPDSIQVRRGTSQMNLLKERLSNFGMGEIVVSGDGNCQFRAISHELFGTQEHHAWVRAKAVAHMQAHPDESNVFFGSPEEFEAYLEKMSKNGEWGDELTLKAVADALCVTVHVLTSTEGFGGYYLEYAPQVATQKEEGSHDNLEAGWGCDGGEYDNDDDDDDDDDDDNDANNNTQRHVFLTYLSPVHYNVMTIRDDERRKRFSDKALALLSRANSMGEAPSLIMQVPSASIPASPTDVAELSGTNSSGGSADGSSSSLNDNVQPPETNHGGTSRTEL